jgi:hypothetical protein
VVAREPYAAAISPLPLTRRRSSAPVVRMWRHIPKITVLAAIGLMVLIFYVTRWNQAPAPGSGKAAPSVVYINQGAITEKSPAPRP